MKDLPLTRDDHRALIPLPLPEITHRILGLSVRAASRVIVRRGKISSLEIR